MNKIFDGDKNVQKILEQLKRPKKNITKGEEQGGEKYRNGQLPRQTARSR